MEKYEELLRGALKIRQPDAKEGLRVNIDTILLAHFVSPKKDEKILELGCAHGAISLILAKRGFAVKGIDIQPHLIELAKENAAFNGISAEFETADLREYKKIAAPQSFDRVVVNPPYFEAASSSRVSPSSAVASARQGTDCSLEDVVSASRYLLKNRGRLDIIMAAQRSAELFALLENSRIGVKKVRFVYPKPRSEASVVLIEAVRAAKKGTSVLPPLFVLDADGKETEEMLENYSL